MRLVIRLPNLIEAKLVNNLSHARYEYGRTT